MIEPEFLKLIADNGFAMVVAVILLYDKIKSNGSLIKVVENNNAILKRVEKTFCKGV